MKAKINAFQVLYAAGFSLCILWLIFSHTVTFAPTSDQSLVAQLHDHPKAWRIEILDGNSGHAVDRFPDAEKAQKLLQIFLAKHRQDHLRQITEYDHLALVAGAFCLIGLWGEKFRKGKLGGN